MRSTIDQWIRGSQMPVRFNNQLDSRENDPLAPRAEKAALTLVYIR